MLEFVGSFFVEKYRTMAGNVGYYQTARNMRKQGIPLWVATLILFNR